MDREKSSTVVTGEAASANLTTTARAASLLPGVRRRIQSFLLVWLDVKFNKADPDFHKSIQALRRIVASIDTFTDAQECIDFIRNIKEEKVFMIVSGSSGQYIVPEIQSLPQMESIYVICGDKTAHEQWSKEMFKVKGVYTGIDSICEALAIDRRICDRNMVSISFNRVDPKFMYTQLLKDAIMEIEDDDKEQIKKLVDFCEPQGDIDRDQINQVRTEYRQHTPIWWYTTETFMYQMLNRGLREMNTDIILNMQFFIRHLHKHIAELYMKQKQDLSSSQINGKFTVYRGQGLSTEVFEKLKNAKGELMSFNNFLSTSLKREVSLGFAMQTRSEMIGILFVMSIDSEVAETSNIPYADVSQVGYLKGDEAEILFTTHTIFRINHIHQMTDDQLNRLWEVQLTLAGSDDMEFNELMTHVHNEIGGESWDRMGMTLIKMGEPGKAEELYEALLARETNERERADYLHQLGWVCMDRGEYSKAVEFYDRSRELYRNILPADDPALTASYNNIGLVYSNMGEYSKALEYYQQSFEARKIALPPNHPDLAASYNNIGSVHRNMGEYAKALEAHQKSLEIRKIALPPNHPDLAASYNNIGLVYDDMSEYSQALEYYRKSLEIKKIALSSNHPGLAISYNNIGLVYNEMDEYSKALEYYQKSLEIRKIALPPNDLELATCYSNIGSVFENLKDYGQALAFYLKAQSVWRKLLPRDHPDISAVKRNIEKVVAVM